MAKIDTQEYRNRYDQMIQRLKTIEKQRRPVLQDYERATKESLRELVGSTLPQAKDLFGEADQAGDIVQDQYLPAASEFIQDARGYDTEERRTDAAGRAMSDVAVAGEAARAGALDRLEAYGVDPSMTRGAALDANLRLGTALGQVSAGQEARRNVEDEGREYMGQAMQVGQNVQQGGLRAVGLGTDIMTGNTQATNATADMWANIWGKPVDNVRTQADINRAGVDAKATETQLKLAGKSGGSPWGGIGSAVGMIGGAALGSYLGPGGAAFGAQLGGQAGGEAGGQAARGY